MSEQMIKRVAWLGYGVIYLYLNLSQNLTQYNLNGSPLLLLMNSIMPVAMAYAIFGYAFDKAFMERMIWRFLFWILSIRFIFVAYVNINAGVVDNLYILLHLLIPLPGLYLLYRYSELENPIWLQRERNEHLKFANELFNHKPKATANLTPVEGEGISCSAVLERTVDGYELALTITENEETKNENYKFETALQALEYIEENTPLSMYEFE